MDILERETPEKPLRLAVLPVSLKALEGALHLPEGYQFVSASYDEPSRMLNLLVTGDGLPEAESDRTLPTAHLNISVEWISPELREYRRYRSELKV